MSVSFSTNRGSFDSLNVSTSSRLTAGVVRLPAQLGHRLGAAGIGQRIAGFGDNSSALDAVSILTRDFSAMDLVGPVRVAEFLGGPDEGVQADAAGFVRAMLETPRGAKAEGAGE